MTISATGVRAVYSGSGSTGPFTLEDADSNPILFETNSEIVATQYDSDGDATVLTITTDYNLTGAGSESAGSLTLVTALAVGETLVIQRVTPITQGLDLYFGGDLSLENLESRLDRHIRIMQELDERLDRAVLLAITTSQDPNDFDFPEPSAGKIIGWNSAGNNLTNIDPAVEFFVQNDEPSTEETDGSLWIDADSADLDLYQLSSGTWTDTTVNLKGGTGATGDAGSDGTDGRTILSGSGAPGAGTGENGDFYIDTDVYDIYGPKAGGAWGGGTSLVGPAGAGSGDVTGPAGATDNRIVRFDSTTGKLIQESTATLTDGGALSGLTNLTMSGGDSFLAMSDTDTGADAEIDTNNATGSMVYRADINNEVASSTHVWDIDGASVLELTPSILQPASDDGIALGAAANRFSDLFLASGAVVDFDNGDITLTHSANTIALAGGVLDLPNTGLHVLDTGGDHDLIITPSTDLSADRTLSIDMGDADRTLTVANLLTVGIPLILDGAGSELTTGVKADIPIPFACTLTGWDLVTDQTGTITIDIWKDTYANYPPTNADTITGGGEPSVGGGSKAQDTTLSGWTTSIAAGDILRFNVDAINTVTRATLMLYALKG